MFFFAFNAPPPINGSAIIGDRILSVLKEEKEGDFDKLKVVDTKLYDKVAHVGFYGLRLKFFKFYRVLYAVTAHIPKNSRLYIAYNLNPFGLVKLFILLIFNYYRYKRIYIHNHMSINNKRILAFLFNLFTRLYPIFISRSESTLFKNGLYIPNVSFIEDKYVEKNEFSIIRLLFMSHLFTWKGVLDILFYVRQLKDFGYRVECRIFGLEGDLSFNDVIYKIREMSISSNVSVKGPVYDDSERVKQLNWANLVFYPSRKDYAPLFLLECSQFGIPVLSYDVGIISELMSSCNSGTIVTSVNEACDRTIEIMSKMSLKELSSSTRRRYLTNYSLDIWTEIVRKTLMDDY